MIEEALPAPAFDFAQVVNALYHLVFDDFCDWYAEAIKPRLYAATRPPSPPRTARSSGCSRCSIRSCRT